MSDESIRSEIECSEDSLETVYYRGALIVDEEPGPEMLNSIKAQIERLRELGVEVIDD